MDTIYSPEWVSAHFGKDAAAHDMSAPSPRCEPLSDVIARHSRAFAALPDRSLPENYAPHPANGHSPRA